MKIIVYKDSDPVFTYGEMKTQCFDTSENTCDECFSDFLYHGFFGIKI